jgi:HrpA-like RNA helicase
MPTPVAGHLSTSHYFRRTLIPKMARDDESQVLNLIRDFVVQKRNTADNGLVEELAQAYNGKSPRGMNELLASDEADELGKILRLYGVVPRSADTKMESPLKAARAERGQPSPKEKGHKTAAKGRTKLAGKQLHHQELEVIEARGLKLFMNRAIPDTLMPEMQGVKNRRPERGSLLAFLNKVGREDGDVEDTIESRMQEIFEKMESNQVILIQGSTGCGKTTRIPRYLLKKYGRIVCSQPRRIAAISIAKKVAADMEAEIGTTVGYAVRFDECCSRNTRLKYITDGVLLRELSSNRLLEGYDVVVIDEAHERTINIDILLAYLKGILVQRSDLRVVVMSATLSAEKFLNFFGCPIVEIRHKVFPLENFFLRKEAEDLMTEILTTVIQIHKTEDKGDILVFLTGQNEIKEAARVLGRELDEKEVTVLMIYSSLSPEQQEAVFLPSRKRKIVLATNIAETSITIDNIKYVVDSGRVKQMRFSPILGMEILEVVWISKAQAKQRSGRAGRTQPGKVFRIYTKSEYEAMSEDTLPNILCSNLSNTLLLLKSLGVDDILSFDLMDRPDVESVRKGLQLLYYLKAIGADGGITALGRRMACMPVEPELAVSLIAAERLGCLEDLIIIASMLSIECVWADVPKWSNLYQTFMSVRSLYFDRRGDYFSLLKIYRSWEKRNFKSVFLSENFLNARMMKQALRIKQQLCMQFKGPWRSNESAVSQAFCAGYFMNVAAISLEGYTNIFTGAPCFIHSSSCLSRQYPSFVLYHSLCRTEREYITMCLEITVDDLLKGANHIFVDGDLVPRKERRDKKQAK